MVRNGSGKNIGPGIDYHGDPDSCSRKSWAQAENLAVVKEQEKTKTLPKATFSCLSHTEGKLETERKFFGLHILIIYFTSERLLVSTPTAPSY